jgi:EAL domain-containing protein (putative c-di-GMP-specific phosphodiesterase class I)
MKRPDKRLLVIDDEHQICELVTDVAQEIGFQIAQATTHAEFDRLFREFKPNFIVMDLAMPDGDGIELLRFLSIEQCKAGIILMSGLDQKLLNTARQLGENKGLNVIGTLQKPIQIDDLEALLCVPAKGKRDLQANELVQALEEDQFEILYQPKIIVGDGVDHAIEDVEALVRWQHPDRGLMSPDSFLGLTEQANLMLPLTCMIARKVFQQARAWREQGLIMSVAINVSPDLLNNLKLPDEIADLAQEYSIPTNQVMVEITESGVMEDPMLALDILTRFRIKGFRLSIDDFGTGFSSLAQLYKMPFSELKIDQSFVRDVTTSEEARLIVTTTTNMAHGLGLTVCAEGVEDGSTYQFLKTCGCEKLQGYLISRPVPGDEIFNMGGSWRFQH